METESKKHSVPVPVFISIPGTIAGISTGLPCVVYHCICTALRISDLRLGDSRKICPPFSCQSIRHRCFPVCFRFLLTLRHCLLLHCDSRKDQCISCTHCHHYCQTCHDTAPDRALLRLFQIVLLRFPLHLPRPPFYSASFFSFITVQSVNPKSDSGQILNMIFPAICSSDTHPTELLLLSTDVLL